MTDLRTALRDAVDAAPSEGLDLGGVIAAGERRVHRRRLLVAAAVSVAVVVAVVAASLPGGRPRADRPGPAVFHLDHTRTIDPDVVAVMRATAEDPNSVDGYLGITSDGSVLRTRYDSKGLLTGLGLLDVDTGQTAWLPPPPFKRPGGLVELGSKRLVFFDWGGDPAVVTYDRESGTWERHPVRFDEAAHFVTERPVLGPGGRAYVLHASADPLQWWSFPLGGGVARPEPSLTGSTIAWLGETRVSGDVDGRITMRQPGQQTVVVNPPADCDLPRGDHAWPPQLQAAGAQLAAVYDCSAGGQTVVYDDQGRALVEIDGNAFIEGADERFLVLSGFVDENDSDVRAYAFDLERNELAAFDADIMYIRGGPPTTTGGGLALLPVEGPSNTNSTVDVVYRVVRLGVQRGSP